MMQLCHLWSCQRKYTSLFYVVLFASGCASLEKEFNKCVSKRCRYEYSASCKKLCYQHAQTIVKKKNEEAATAVVGALAVGLIVGAAVMMDGGDYGYSSPSASQYDPHPCPKYYTSYGDDPCDCPEQRDSRGYKCGKRADVCKVGGDYYDPSYYACY